MSEWIDLYLLVAKTAVLSTGLIIVFYTARAAFHSGDVGLWFLSLGIALAGVGLLLAGLLARFLGIGVELDSTITSSLAAIGLAIVIYSMFREPQVPLEPK